LDNKLRNLINDYAVGLVFHETPEENAYKLLMESKNEKEFYKLDNFTLSEEYETESFSSIKRIVDEKVSELEYFLDAVNVESTNLLFHVDTYKALLQNSIRNPFVELSLERLSNGKIQAYLFHDEESKDNAVRDIINDDKIENIILQLSKQINEINNPNLVTGMHNIYLRGTDFSLDDDLHNSIIESITYDVTMNFNESGSITIDNVEYDWEVGRTSNDINTNLIESLSKKEEVSTRKIRLEWSHFDTWTFEDLTVPTNYPENEIKDSINLALAYGEDEVNKFIEISKNKGYEVNLFRENIEVYNFDYIDEDEATEETLVKKELIGKGFNDEDMNKIYDIASCLLSSDGGYTIAEATSEAILEFNEETTKEAANELRELMTENKETSQNLEQE
jgi:hypothetical protein